MDDLVAMQPNLNIQLLLVAPEDRREKVFAEVNRPTFSRLDPRLAEIPSVLNRGTRRVEFRGWEQFKDNHAPKNKRGKRVWDTTNTQNHQSKLRSLAETIAITPQTLHADSDNSAAELV